jgi:integrase
VITISRRGILELLAGASALTALETCHRMPRECTTGCRSIWKGHEQAPKTRSSAAPVPVISQLASRLELHRGREMARLHRSDLESGPMFTNAKGGRMDMSNLEMRFIKPSVNRCAVCRGTAGKKHLRQDHDFIRDETIPRWRGWHGFRRGVGTNLHELGESDIGVQKILRHSDVNTTRAYYIKPDEQSKRLTMAKLEAEVADKMSLREPRDTDGTPAIPPETIN